jgi:hypothetical protein
MIAAQRRRNWRAMLILRRSATPGRVKKRAVSSVTAVAPLEPVDDHHVSMVVAGRTAQRMKHVVKRPQARAQCLDRRLRIT